MKNSLIGTELYPTVTTLLWSKKKKLARLLALAAALALPCSSRAQNQVYNQDFEVNHNADGSFQTNFVNGAITTDNGTSSADAFFDYSTVGIPLSPHSTNSATHALKMVANFQSGFGATPTGLSVLPLGLAVTPNFEMHFDLWENYNGPANGGGNGSTLIGGAGYGTAGALAQVGGIVAPDSVFFGVTGDGGSTFDYRAYTPAHPAGYVDGVYQIGSVGSDTTQLGDPTSGYVYSSTNGTRNAAIAPWITEFPGQTPPAAQIALFPQQTGVSQDGAMSFKWHEVAVTKIAGIITYKIDGFLIATVNAADAGAVGGSNVFFNEYDINSTVSSDANFAALNFTLIDNIRITNYPNLVAISTTNSSITEGSGVAGVFIFTRSTSGTPLTITYAITGDASNGVDYVDGSSNALTGTLTFAANDTTTNLSVYAIHDGISEPIEKISLSVINGTNYVGAGLSTIGIIDIDPPQLAMSTAPTQVFERTNDFGVFTIIREGLTNAASFPVNVTFSGTAGYGTNFYTNVVVTFEPGVQTTNITIYPIEDGIYTGNLTITCTLASGAGYTVGTPSSASMKLEDEDHAPETVLFQDNLQTDTSANWTILHAANTGIADDSLMFGYDYSAFGIPPAPHSGGTTTGLYITANKNNGVAAAVNLYPTGRSFSGNYALRFDMFQTFNPGTSSTEYIMCGMNHSGTKTNWWRSGGVPGGWTFDGIFYTLETDGGSTPSFVNYSSPTVAVTTNSNPTQLFAGVSSLSVANIFPAPPFAVAGSPAIATGSATPIWSSVEVSQIGNIQTLRINNSTIFSYSNATPYVSGNVMLGYLDAYDSLGPASDYAFLSNVRVVSLQGLKITGGTTVGANFQLDFSFDLTDSPAGFALQTATNAAGPYTDSGASITQTSPGNYRATIAQTTGAHFYRVRHL